MLWRHAKSSWRHPEYHDHERPLNKRGKGNAAMIARRLEKERLLPDHILSSTAKRARRTAEFVLDANPFAGMTLLYDLYECDGDQVLRSIAEHGGDADTLLVVGHNPGIEGAMIDLSDDDSTVVKTGVLAALRLDIDDWAALDGDDDVTGELLHFWEPRLMRFG